MLSILYIIPTPSIYSRLWDHMVYFHHHINITWLAIGDFIEALFPSEMSGNIFLTQLWALSVW